VTVALYHRLSTSLGRRTAVLAGSLSGGQSAMADAVPVHYADRMFEIEPVGLSEDAIQKRQHLVVRIRSASAEDDTRAGGITWSAQWSRLPPGSRRIGGPH